MSIGLSNWRNLCSVRFHHMEMVIPWTVLRYSGWFISIQNMTISLKQFHVIPTSDVQFYLFYSFDCFVQRIISRLFCLLWICVPVCIFLLFYGFGLFCKLLCFHCVIYIYIYACVLLSIWQYLYCLTCFFHSLF